MSIVRNVRRETMVLVVLCLAAFFVNNGVLPTGITEARTVVTAREVVENGDWTALSMNGESRLNKPPLATWISAMVELAYPRNISAQRAVAGLMATLWALFFFSVARYLERRRGFAEIATVVFLTYYNVVYFGRMVSRDIYGYAFMMCGIYFMLRLFFDERYYSRPHKWRWALLSGLAVGLSLLSNGTVAFYSMLLPFVVALCLIRRPEMNGRWMPLLLLVVVALVTAGWWIVYLLVKHPEAIDDVFRNEWNSWTESHRRPWFYYWRFFIEMGVWAIFVLASLVVRYWYKRVSTKRLYLLSIAWLLAALVLLSVVPSKRMTDFLSLAPPCALAVACLLYYYYERGRSDDRWARLLFSVNGYLVALVAFCLPLFIHFRLTNWHIVDYGTAVFVNVFFLAIAVYVAVSTYRHEAVGLIRGVLALFFVIECFMLGSVTGLLTNPHRRSIGMLNMRKEYRELPLYYSKNEPLRIELVYEAGRRILPLDLSDSEAVSKAAPCLLLTREPLSAELPSDVFERVDTLSMGVFDDNRFSRHNKHYNPDFVNQVSVLRPKNQ